MDHICSNKIGVKNMQSYWKKMIVAVLAVVASAAFATNGYSDTQEPTKTFHEQGHAKTESQMMAGYNAPARVNTHGYDFFTWGSFIYWQAMGEHLALGILPSVPEDNYSYTQKIYDMDFDWKPGFKVGIGTSTDYDHWDFCAEYTWLHGSNSKRYSPDPTLFIQVPRHLDYEMWANSLYAKWDIDFDILDVELARSYYVGTKYSFRTHFGVRAAWLNQEYKENIYVLESGPHGAGPNWWYYTGKTRNWGVGPRIGVDINWMFTEGFRFFSNAASSILYSRYRITEKEVNVYSATTSAFETIYQKNTFHALRPTLEMLGGFGWGTYLGDGEYHFDISAAYEFHIFWNQESMRFNDMKGDLSLNGLTVTARFDF